MLRRIPTLLLIAAITSSFIASAGEDPNIFAALAKKTIPSVVNISILSKGQAGPWGGHGGPQGRPGGPEDLFKKFFEDYFNRRGGRPPAPRPDDEEDDGEDDGGGARPIPNGDEPQLMALGTGFIIDKSGLILTNNHVVQGADSIKIQFTEDEDEKQTDGKVVGRDPDLDLALIKVNTKQTLVPIELGDSDALQVGEYVMAVGNPFGQGHSVTHGIISAKGRKSPDFVLANYIQTDAPINPGNSGGPLVNLKGEVIGINNAIDQRAQGIGFAIPINLVKQVLPQLKTKGSVSRGYIGIQVNDLTPEIAQRIGAPKDLRAPFVAHVYPGEPADKAGIKPYDIATEFNGKKLRSSGDLIAGVTSLKVGEGAPMKLLRNGKEMTVTVVVGRRPTQPIEAAAQPDSKRSPKQNTAREISGIEVETLSPATARELGVSEKMKGAVVNDLKYDGPGDRAGLLRGDVIVEIDRKPVKTAEQFYALMKERKSYLLRVLRPDPNGPSGRGDNFQVLVLDLK